MNKKPQKYDSQKTQPLCQHWAKIAVNDTLGMSIIPNDEVA